MRCALPDPEVDAPELNDDTDPTGFWFWVDGATLHKLGQGDIRRGRREMKLIIADERDRRPHNGPVKKPDRVRLGGLGDEADILALIQADMAENAPHIGPPSDKKILESLAIGTRGKGGFCLVVDGPSGRPIAASLLIPMAAWWTEQTYLSEVFLYVAPSARRSRAAEALLQYQCWLSQEMSRAAGHTVYLLAGVTATRRGRAKLRLYHRYLNPCGGWAVFPNMELTP